MEEDREISWSTPLETLVASEGEKCRGLAWINQKAEVYYARRANAIAIPVIVLSTLAGTASVGSSSLFGEETKNASIAIGLVNILCGILTTISSYYSWSRKSESHRVAFLQYSKLFSIIRVEMSLPRSERQEAEQLLLQIRQQMERLAETTPSPPPSILEEFNRHFRDEDQTISRPVEVNGLQKISIYRVPSDAKNISLGIEDARTNQREARQSQEGRDHQAAPSPARSEIRIEPIRGGGTRGEDQSDSHRQETDASERDGRTYEESS